MTIDDVKKLQSEAEAKIAQIIVDFMSKTCTVVDGVDVKAGTNQTIAGARQSYLYGVAMRVKLA